MKAQIKKMALSQNLFDKIKVSITERGGIRGTFMVALVFKYNSQSWD